MSVAKATAVTFFYCKHFLVSPVLASLIVAPIEESVLNECVSSR